MQDRPEGADDVGMSSKLQLQPTIVQCNNLLPRRCKY